MLLIYKIYLVPLKLVPNDRVTYPPKTFHKINGSLQYVCTCNSIDFELGLFFCYSSNNLTLQKFSTSLQELSVISFTIFFSQLSYV